MQKRHRLSQQLTRRGFLGSSLGAVAVTSPTLSGALGVVPSTVGQAGPSSEPDIETAFQWWSELPDKWTVIGWKDHMLRFNVLFDGTVVADPFTNQRTEQWREQGVQLSFAPSPGGTPARSYYKTGDDNAVLQGWSDHPTPVLWSEWKSDSLYLRQEVFAHVPGGRPVETGIEPIYAWLRLAIIDWCEGLPREETYGFAIRINAPCLRHTMDMRNTLMRQAELSKYPPVSVTTGYPRRLYVEPESYLPERALLLREKSVWERPEDARVRMAVLAGQKCRAVFTSGKPTDRDSSLYIEMDVERGRHVDLLLPMLPARLEDLAAEMDLGFEAALQEANRFWSLRPPTAATFETSEPHVNRSIEYNLKFAEVIAERNPESGHYSLLTGSWVYANLWATPMAFTSVWFLDSLGYHSVVAKYLRVFKDRQGTVVAPGDAFRPHPGYLSTPPDLTSIDWLSDHGALLYAIASHALLSGDRDFIDDWQDAMVKACEFIRDARRISNHGGFPGIMPPAVATDRRTRIQAVWNDGWMYKGLLTAGRLLTKTKHPRAGEFVSEAEAYRQAFVRALEEKTKSMPEWTDSRGNKHRLVPTSLFGETGEELRHAFYLDTGPLFLVFAGLLPADHDLMKSALLWFREGPQTKMYRYDSNCWQVPCLVHEISSCEPSMNWAGFHSHQLGDRHRFLECMYSLFSAHISRQTYTSCETRGGVTSLTPSLTEFYLARLSVVDDQLNSDELHLLRLMPLAWLRNGQTARFEKLPTEFGPVTLRVSLGQEELQVEFVAQYREKPRRVVLHIPPVDNLKRIRLNRQSLKWNGKATAFDLT
ncbi:MAG: hypothetical protein AB1898_24570 [Acidobacteriota bacterium]